MKKIFSLLIYTTVSLIFCGTAKAKLATETVSFSGIVVNNTNTPLPYATITLHEIKLATITNTEGKFVFNKIKTGKYLVEVSYVGYSSIIEVVDISTALNKKFVLQQSIANHDEVTVTGVSSASKIKQATQPISIVKKTDLLQTTATNIIDALSKNVAGVATLTSSPAIAKPIIRGLGYNRVVVINDGIRQEGQQWGDEHGIEIDENSVQKIELLKGAASLIYGSDAMAGVVNIVTTSPIEQGYTKANIGYNYASNNNVQNLYANMAGNLHNGFNYNLYASTKKAKDYENKIDGRVFNSRFFENNFGGYIGLNKNWGYTQLLFSNFNQKLGIITGDRDNITGNFLIFSGTPQEREATMQELNSTSLYTPYQQIQHFKIASNSNIALAKGRLNINFGLQLNNRKEFGDADNANTPNLFFNLKTFTYNLQYIFKEKNNFKTTVGVSGMQQQNLNKASEVLIPEYTQTDAGLFIVTTKNYSNLILTTGVRFDTRTLHSKDYFDGTFLKFTHFTKQFLNFSASTGISYAITKNVTLKANIAKAFRAPNIAELATNGIHEGTDRYEYGNTNLASETSLQLDAGIEYNTQHFTLSTNLFYNNIYNYIYYSKLINSVGTDSIVITPNGQGTAYKFMQNNANLYGFEANLDIHPHPLDWLHFENSFSMVIAKFSNAIQGNNNIPFIPAPHWQSELKADFTKVNKWLQNAYAKVELDYFFKQKNVFTVYNTETQTPSYNLINIGFGGNVHHKKTTICQLHCAINNVANIVYQPHLSRLKYTAINNATGNMGVFSMGTNFSLKIIVPIHKKIRSTAK